MVTKNYTKDELIKFISYNYNVIDPLKDSVNNIPETINYKGNDYSLYVYIDEKDNNFTFEINYYSDNILEFLFKVKKLSDLEIALNRILNELKKIKYEWAKI